MLCREREIRMPSDAVHLFRQFLGENQPDCEAFMVMCLAEGQHEAIISGEL